MLSNGKVQFCEVCEKSFYKATEATFTANVYPEEGNPKELKLCFGHDVELFKKGQCRFLCLYPEIE